MTSLQHQAVSRVTSDSCSAPLPPAAAPPPSGRRSSTTWLERVAGTRSTTPHRMKSREATWVAANWRSGRWQMCRECGPVHGRQRRARGRLLADRAQPPSMRDCDITAAALSRTCDGNGRANQAHRAVHNLHHCRRLRCLEWQLNRLHLTAAGRSKASPCRCAASEQRTIMAFPTTTAHALPAAAVQTEASRGGPAGLEHARTCQTSCRPPPARVV